MLCQLSTLIASRRTSIRAAAVLRPALQPAPGKALSKALSKALRSTVPVSRRHAAGAVLCRARTFAVSASAEEFEVDVKVQGMMCDGCASTVTAALKSAKGVSNVKVDLASGLVTVGVQADSMMEVLSMLPACVDAVKAAGFEAEVEFNESAEH